MKKNNGIISRKKKGNILKKETVKGKNLSVIMTYTEVGGLGGLD